MSDKLKVSLNFTKRLIQERDKNGLSQAQLAETAGIQQSALSLYEGGQRRPSFTNLKRLSRTLGVSVDYLVGNSEFRLPQSPASDELVSAVLKLGEEDREVVKALVDSLLSRDK